MQRRKKSVGLGRIGIGEGLAKVRLGLTLQCVKATEPKLPPFEGRIADQKIHELRYARLDCAGRTWGRRHQKIADALQSSELPRVEKSGNGFSAFIRDREIQRRRGRCISRVGECD